MIYAENWCFLISVVFFPTEGNWETHVSAPRLFRTQQVTQTMICNGWIDTKVIGRESFGAFLGVEPCEDLFFYGSIPSQKQWTFRTWSEWDLKCHAILVVSGSPNRSYSLVPQEMTYILSSSNKHHPPSSVVVKVGLWFATPNFWRGWRKFFIGHTLAISEYSTLVNNCNLRRTCGFVGYLPKIDYSVMFIFKYLRNIIRAPVEFIMFQLQWFVPFFLHKLRKLHQDTTDAMGVPEWLPFAAGLILGGTWLAYTCFFLTWKIAFNSAQKIQKWWDNILMNWYERFFISFL